MRSLKIDIQQTGNAVTFQSLGEDPKLEATLAHRSRLTALAWGVSLLIGLYGLRLTNRPTRVKFRYVATVLVISALVPLAGDWFEELAETFDLAFLTGCLLIPYYMAAAALRWTFQRVGSVAKLEPVTVTGAVLIALLLLGSDASAQQPTAKPTSEILADLEKLIVPGKPVDVPKDAIVVPYEGQPNVEADPAQKLLVPYEQYVELWNRAYPDQKIITRPLPATHALAGAQYKATLADGEYLLISGQLADRCLQRRDGRRAAGAGRGRAGPRDGRWPAGAAARAGSGRAAPVAARSWPAPPAGNLYVLHVSGKGRKTLDIGDPLEAGSPRRLARGRGPLAQRAGHVAGAHRAAGPDGSAAGQRARSAGLRNDAKPTRRSKRPWPPAGQMNIQWRPKVGEGQVDQSLTADSTAVLDVREDGLRLHWQMKLDFRRGQREVFTLRLPKDYLVERVTGTNVRGWEVKALRQQDDRAGAAHHAVEGGPRSRGVRPGALAADGDRPGRRAADDRSARRALGRCRAAPRPAAGAAQPAVGAARDGDDRPVAHRFADGRKRRCRCRASPMKARWASARWRRISSSARRSS